MEKVWTGFFLYGFFSYKDVGFLCVGYRCHLFLYIIFDCTNSYLYYSTQFHFFVVGKLLSIFHNIKHFNDNSITTVTKMSVSLNSTTYQLIVG